MFFWTSVAPELFTYFKTVYMIFNKTHCCLVFFLLWLQLKKAFQSHVLSKKLCRFSCLQKGTVGWITACRKHELLSNA